MPAEGSLHEMYIWLPPTVTIGGSFFIMLPKRAIIFANGVFNDAQRVKSIIQPDDLIVAADAGALHSLASGFTPHAVIGDFDSLSANTLHNLHNAGVLLMRYPAQKNETDLELAIQYACQQGATEILVFGALGARWDMSMSSFLLLAHPRLSSENDCSVRITLLAGCEEIFLLHPGAPVHVSGRAGDTVSLIPIAQDVHGVITRRLKYPLNADTLFFGTTRGISNVMLAEHATVQTKQGLLLCFILHQEE